MSSTSSEDAIPVTVFINHKLMNSKPIERLKSIKFDRLRIECVSDEEEIPTTKDTGSKAAVGWWFSNSDILSKYIEENENKQNIIWTHSASAGVDHLLKYDAIKKHKSIMTNAKGAFSASLGEWTIFASMYYAKEVFNMQKAQKEKVWKRFQVDMLKNKEMLVVGYGDIGRSIGKRAKALGMVVNGVRSKKVIEERDREVVSQMFTLQDLERAVLGNPAVMLLDEATSALDAEAEAAVQLGLKQAMLGRTVIVIAHRLATVQEADLIVVLEHGRISQQGSHDDLMSQGGRYRELCERQFIRINE